MSPQAPPAKPNTRAARPPRNQAKPSQELEDTNRQNPKEQNMTALKPGDGRRAARHATDRNSVRLTVPLIGTVDLPPTEELAYIGGVGVLAVVGVLEWPIAAVLAVGRLFANSRHNKTMRDFGEALEQA